MGLYCRKNRYIPRKPAYTAGILGYGVKLAYAISGIGFIFSFPVCRFWPEVGGGIDSKIKGAIMRLMILGLVLMATTAAMAKDFTIATIDFQQVFNTYPGTVKAQKKLTDLIQEKQDDLNGSQKVVIALQKELKHP